MDQWLSRSLNFSLRVKDDGLMAPTMLHPDMISERPWHRRQSINASEGGSAGELQGGQVSLPHILAQNRSKELSQSQPSG